MSTKLYLRGAIILATIEICCGCTHVQLQRNFMSEAEVAHNLQQQQVLDNLAMFSENPDAIPYYNVVGTGLAQVNDTGSIGGSVGWNPKGFASALTSVTGSRINQENYASIPVTDPYKLNWMRTAYRYAVGAPVDPMQLSDCSAIAHAWNKTPPSGCPGPVPGGCDGEVCQCGCDTCFLPSPGWFMSGHKHNVPKGACLVGHYCDTYVWVTPGGTDAFSQLALAIIGYAQTNRNVTWQRNWDCCCQKGASSSAGCPSPMEVPAPSPNEPGAKTKPDGDGIGALNDGIGEDKITMPDLFKGEISLGNLMMQNTKDIIKAISSANNADKTQPCTVTEITSIGTSLSTSSSKAGGGGGAPGVTAAQLFIPATLPFGTQVTP